MAQLENCPTCQNPTSENATICPSCGEPFEEGWAQKIQQARVEGQERTKQLLLKAKRKKQKIWALVALVAILLIFGPGLLDDYKMDALKESDPAEYQRIMSESKKDEQKKHISELEAEVAKVPASNFTKNISLYKKLNILDPKNTKYISKISHYEKKLKEEQYRIKAAREKNEHNKAIIKKFSMGIWQIGNYVDEFDEPIGKKYITNKNFIKGTFSNTATQDSALNVRLLINGTSNIAIMLYEYAGNNPVKVYSPEDYSVYVQDNSGLRITYDVKNFNDRIMFEGSDAQELHKMLMKGGTMKFRIRESDTPTTNYRFNIILVDGYERAFKTFSQ